MTFQRLERTEVAVLGIQGSKGKFGEIEIGSGKLESAESTSLIREYYVSCAEYLIAYRFLPNIMDGLKPSYRRLLMASDSVCKSGLKKSAKILGEALVYHQHSLDGLYTALVGMTAPSVKIPMFKGKGNFGTVEEPPAAYRYTEVMLNKIGYHNSVQFLEHADWEVGESGLDEPVAIPSLVPFNLLSGSYGIGIALRCVSMPLNAIELIDYIIAKIKGETGKVPTPDIGNCIIDMSDADIDKAVLKKKCTLDVKPLVVREGNGIFSISGIPTNGIRIEGIKKKLASYLDSGSVDFRDESDVDSRYVFEVSNKSVNLYDFAQELTKAASSSITFNRMVYEGKDSITCGLDHQIDACLKYLNKCLDRKVEKDLKANRKDESVYMAVKYLKTSPKILKDLNKMTTEELFDALREAGFERPIAKEASEKPISYLTSSHDHELLKVRENIKELKNHDRKKYLISLYEKLKELVLPIYSEKRHSVRRSKLLKTPKISGKGKMLVISNRGLDYEGSVLVILPNGQAIPVHANARVRQEIPLEIDSNMAGIVTDAFPAFAAFTNKNNIIVRETSAFLSEKPIALLSEKEKVTKVMPLSYWGEKNILLAVIDGKSYDMGIFLKKRISAPVEKWTNKYMKG